MSDGERINPDFTTVVVVLCAIVGLVLIAGALPPMTGQGVTDGPGDQLTEPGEELLEDDKADEEGDDEQSTTGENDTDDTPSYELSVASITPGTNATVQVDRGGDPVENASILFDGDEVGETNERGKLRHEMPFVETIDVTAVVEDSEVVAAGASSTATNEQRLSTTVETNAALDVQLSGPIHPGGEATVFVAVGGQEAVSDAAVSLDSAEATTANNGTATLPIGDDVEEFTVETERGELTTSETLSLPLDIDAELSTPMPYPYALGTATVGTTSATDDVVNYEGGTVYLLDEAVEDPDTDDLEAAHTTVSLGQSTEELRLPATPSATIVVDAGGEREVFVLEDLLRNVGIFVVGGTSIIFGITITYGRVLNRSLRHDITLAGRSFKLGALNFGGLLRGLATTYSPTAAFRHAGAGLIGGTAVALRGLLSLRAPSRSLSTLSLALPSLSMPSMPSFGLGSIGRQSDDGGDEDKASNGKSKSDPSVPVDEFAAAAPDVPDTEEPDNRELIRAAWHEFAETAGVSEVETTTPGAAARQARETGLPEPAITALTQTFRQVEYGQGSPTDERTERALRALAVVRAHDGGELS